MRFGFIAVGVLLVGLLGIMLAATGVSAQSVDADPVQPVPVVPPVCKPARYDLNGDARLDIQDLNRWKTLVLRGAGACRVGAPARDCPDGLDADGNGYVEMADLARMVSHYRTCVPAPGIRVPR